MTSSRYTAPARRPPQAPPPRESELQRQADVLAARTAALAAAIRTAAGNVVRPCEVEAAATLRTREMLLDINRLAGLLRLSLDLAPAPADPQPDHPTAAAACGAASPSLQGA